MNFVKYLIPLLLVGYPLSCSDKKGDMTNSDTKSLFLVSSEQVDRFNVSLFTENREVSIGENHIYIQVAKDKEFLNDLEVNWNPIMTSMGHDCPHSEVEKTEGKESLYNGTIDFTMPGNWELIISFKNKSISKKAILKLDVK